jgi:TolA-binding protein
MSDAETPKKVASTGAQRVAAHRARQQTTIDELSKTNALLSTKAWELRDELDKAHARIRELEHAAELLKLKARMKAKS